MSRDLSSNYGFDKLSRGGKDESNRRNATSHPIIVDSCAEENVRLKMMLSEEHRAEVARRKDFASSCIELCEVALLLSAPLDSHNQASMVYTIATNPPMDLHRNLLCQRRLQTLDELEIFRCRKVLAMVKDLVRTWRRGDYRPLPAENADGNVFAGSWVTWK